MVAAGPVLRDDAVAGDEERQGIAAAGVSDGASGAGTTERLRDATVGDGFAVRNFLQQAPDRPIKFGAGKVKGHDEMLARTGEVFVDLQERGVEPVGRLLDAETATGDIKLFGGSFPMRARGERRGRRESDQTVFGRAECGVPLTVRPGVPRERRRCGHKNSLSKNAIYVNTSKLSLRMRRRSE